MQQYNLFCILKVMARLFVSNREIQFINDITKEYIKDISGQYIVYYPISILKTRVHPVYDEAVQKIFDNPIKIDAVVGQPDNANSISEFTVESTTKLQVFIQSRDLIDKGFEPESGDFFSYGAEVFEVLTSVELGDLFGQAENNIYWQLDGKLARSGRFDLPDFKLLLKDAKSFQDAQSQKTFEQQRGLGENDTDGNLADVRQMRERLADDMAPIALGEGGRKVISVDEEDISDTTGEQGTTSFYNE